MKRVCCAAAFTILTSVTHAEDAKLIYPGALSRGDTVMIVAPAGDVERNRMEFCIGHLREMGFRVKVPQSLYRRRGYLAGSDEERASELMAAFRDPEVKAVICATGGYGTTRMLDRLDYDVIRSHPRILTGFSDVTGLHLAVHRKTGLITFHSPFLGPVLEPRPNPFTGDYFWRALLAEKFMGSAGDSKEGYLLIPPTDNPQLQTIAPGICRGRLIGGNLTLISTLMGTPYEIETKGRILFIEDRNEEPYRIDRYLSQLRLAGKLDGLAGVILGVFVECEAKSPGESLTLNQVFDDYFKRLGVPVLANFPTGHFKYNATLPLGVMAELDAEHKEFRLLENPVLLPPATTATSDKDH